MPSQEKIYLAGAVSAILLALRFCVLPLLGGLLLALLPFLAALAVAAAVLPLARRLSRAFALRVEVAGVILTLLALGLVGLGLFFLLRALTVELGELLGYLSGEASPLPSLLDRIRAWAGSLGLGGVLPEENGELLLSSLARLLSSLGAGVGSVIAHLPSIFFFLLSSTIAAVYLVLWLPRARDTLPPRVLSTLLRLREIFLRGLSVYGRAYLILFFVTAFSSLVGLVLLRAPYPLLLALLLAAVDLLPVLGVGTVLIPWSIFSFFVGRFGFGLGLVLLWATVTVLRRILEDRLVGRGLGVHPLVVLLSVCLGLHFFGFLGLFLGPIAAATVAALFRREKTA